MKVLVRDRREGKTTELVKWLLKGVPQAGYPQWSRVILCSSRSAAVDTTRMVQAELAKLTPSQVCAMCFPHPLDAHEEAHTHTLAQIRKAVWSMNDFQHNVRGATFEYAIDDLDYFLQSLIGWKMPAVVAMTGEGVDTLCD